MTEIQRWEVRWNRVMAPQPDGEFVRYADHQAALAEIEERLRDAFGSLRAADHRHLAQWDRAELECMAVLDAIDSPRRAA